MTLPHLPGADQVALFLDFDGTLVDIEDHPDKVALTAPTLEALAILSEVLGGALAIVTGREIAAIDRFAAPLVLPVAGVHGLARRDATGATADKPVSKADIDAIDKALQPFAARETGVMIERKSVSVALHYRARPDLAAVCAERLDAAVRPFAGIEVKRGKMVLEAKPSGADKGTAIGEFLAEAPFAGRTPWVAGDDVTDEDAFREVNRLGGISIKVGDGETAAAYRTADTQSFRSWLQSEAARLQSEANT